MSVLADQLVGILLERGALPAGDLAPAIRRRKADVLKALHDDPRFAQSGRRRASRWSVVPPRSFDAQEAAERWGCDVATVDEILFGESGFLELGLVASLNGNGRVVVTAQGLAIAGAVGSLNPGEGA